MMDPDYDLFVAIARTGSLSAAGREMRISPAMVSKRLTRLEQRLETQLVRRSTRRLELTEAGERLRNDLRTVMALLAEAEDRVSGNPERPSGPLRVSAPTSFGRLHLAPHVGQFLALHPGVELSLDLTDAYVDLIGQRIDLAIRVTDDVPEDLHAHRLAPNERLLCAAPAYLAERPAIESIDDLAGHQLLAATGQLPWKLHRRGAVRVIDGISHVRTNSSEIVRELAIAGVGIALRSLWDVNEELAHGSLVRVLPDWSGSHATAIYAVHPRMTVRNAAVEALIAFLIDLYQAPAPWTVQPSLKQRARSGNGSV